MKRTKRRVSAAREDLMAYIVLTLGVLMSLVGLGAMMTGYPVIEVERGWATVISGAVLLSGGLVTAALGVVIRQLVNLNRGHLGVAPVAAVPLPMATPAEATVPQASPAMPPSNQWAAPPQAEDARPPFALAAPAAAAFAAEALNEPHELHVPHEPHVASETAAPDRPMSEADAEFAAMPGPLDSMPQHPVAASAHDVVEEAEPEHELHAPGHDRGAPPGQEYAAQEDASSPEPEPLFASNEAWLDQAFQAFDYEVTSRHAATSGEPLEEGHSGSAEEPEAVHQEDTTPEQPEPESTEAPRVAVAHEPEPHELEASPEPAASVAHEPAAEAPATAPEAESNLTVIGRYDSEGTSYVMYSDGSIEAQSEAGVYRFGSMAELKAFIEG